MSSSLLSHERVAPPRLVLPPPTFGAYLLEARTRTAWTRPALAPLVGVSPAELGRIESDGCAPPWSEEVLRALARAICADFDELQRRAQEAARALPTLQGDPNRSSKTAAQREAEEAQP